MIKVLRVSEYQSIREGKEFSAREATVTPEQFRQIERFNERYLVRHKVKVFQHGARRTLIAQNFVGVIQLDSFQIEVLPKIEAEERQVRRNLLEMVATTLDLTLLGEEFGLLDRTDQTVIDVLVQLYCRQLWKVVHKGLTRRYVEQRESLTVMRGRLNLAAQLRHNFARPERMDCTFDVLTQDNPLNQAIKAALRVLQKNALKGGSARSINELLFCFDEIADVAPGSIRWDQLTTDRMSEPYRPLVQLSRLFIEDMSPDITAGHGDGFAVLFDMNKLFEEYVGRQMRRINKVAGLKTQLQGPVRHLARREGGSECFQLRPDIVVMRDGDPSVVIDTKWKRLKASASGDDVATADLYQMFAYAKQYLAASVVLLYPHHPGLGQWVPYRSRFHFRRGESVALPHALHIATVPLDDLKLVPERLQEILTKTDGYRTTVRP